MRKRSFGDLITLFTRDIWLADYSAAGRRLRGTVGLGRLAYMVVHGFIADRCLLSAAAMAYTTILSIAPLLAVAFSISKALGIQNTVFIRDLLERLTAGRQAMVEQIVTYIDQTNVRTLGYLGVAFLFATAISLLASIEEAFNSIWRVGKSRSWWRKFTDYFSVLLICPIFVLVAASVTVSLQTDAFVQKILAISAFNYLYLALLKVFPFVMISLAFMFLYGFMPNTKVRVKSALVGGVVAGSLWQLAQWSYIEFQVGAANFNAIYGSFAQFPIFLVWMYISWTIVLLGAELSFAVQNWRTFQGQVRAEQVTPEEKDKVAVLVLLIQTKRFERGERPLDNERLAEHLGVPLMIVAEVAAVLARAGMLVRLDSPEAVAYGLAMPPEKIRVMDVVGALSRRDKDERASFIREEYAFVEGVFGALYGEAEGSPDNVDMKTFYERMCAQHVDKCLEPDEEGR
jgi:membrane protein